MSKRLVLPTAVLVALIVPLGRPVSLASEPAPRAGHRFATLIVVNGTACPVLIYADGRFIARCEPLTRQKIYSRAFGEVQLVGRSRCDTWGPNRVTLQPGRTIVWRLRPLPPLR